MDKNRVAGSINAAKEAVGKAVGDAKLQSDGKSEQRCRVRHRLGRLLVDVTCRSGTK